MQPALLSYSVAYIQQQVWAASMVRHIVLIQDIAYASCSVRIMAAQQMCAHFHYIASSQVCAVLVTDLHRDTVAWLPCACMCKSATHCRVESIRWSSGDQQHHAAAFNPATDDAHRAWPPSGLSVRQTAECHHPLTPQHPHCQLGSVPLQWPQPPQVPSRLEGPAIDTVFSSRHQAAT